MTKLGYQVLGVMGMIFDVNVRCVLSLVWDAKLGYQVLGVMGMIFDVNVTDVSVW